MIVEVEKEKVGWGLQFEVYNFSALFNFFQYFSINSILKHLKTEQIFAKTLWITFGTFILYIGTYPPSPSWEKKCKGGESEMEKNIVAI